MKTERQRSLNLNSSWLSPTLLNIGIIYAASGTDRLNGPKKWSKTSYCNRPRYPGWGSCKKSCQLHRSEVDWLRGKIWRFLCCLHKSGRWTENNHQSKQKALADRRMFQDHENWLFRKACISAGRKPDPGTFFNLFSCFDYLSFSRKKDGFEI